ncbi:putative transposase, Ptta/En/Spm, plant [Senna tora]|uniref:Putative transposase, Ptta/En/Spm, plant n=1 Tax=Senna tora TaxID=362788 RepID=A0A834SXG6_9FABA|nr:putative transposase, Ptta/En/Spm, plant [Senna tora]
MIVQLSVFSSLKTCVIGSAMGCDSMSGGSIFVEGYLNWTIHGEKAWGGEGSAFNDADDEEDTGNPYVDMVVDAVQAGRVDDPMIRQLSYDGVKVDGKYGLVDVDYRSKLQSNEPFILEEQAQVYYTKYSVSGSRVNGEWWTACKVRAKLFMDETLNSVGEVSNEFSTFDYYQDDESLTIHDRTSEEEEINLLDAHGLMEEVNVDELPNPLNAPHTDQFINVNEETDHNEFLDSDEELFDSDSRSPLVTTPSASVSPTYDNNSRDFPSPSPELPGASTGHILDDSVESTVPHAGVDRRKHTIWPTFVTRSIMSSVFGRMSFAAERWRDYSAEVKEELFKEFMEKYRFQSDNDRKMAREVWEKTCGDRYSDILTKHREVLKASVHHKKKMEAKQNQKVSWRDVYHKTHKKKNGEFVSEHSRHFAENLDIVLLDKYGEESSSYPEVDANLWLDVAPHSKKGRIHGLGKCLQLSSGSPNSTSSACSACSTTSSTTAPIIPQSQIDEAISRAMATMWSTQMAPMLQSFMS